jgi:hypothetical protein
MLPPRRAAAIPQLPTLLHHSLGHDLRRHDTRHGTIGLYYDRAERPNQQNIPFSSQWLAAYGNPAAFFGNAFNGYNTLFYGTNTATNTERSVFGQGTYHITDKLSATTNRRLVSRVSAAVSP